MRFRVLLSVIGLMFWGQAWAEDFGFATNRDEIIQQLSAPKYAKTRSFSTRSLSRQEDQQPRSVNLKIEFDANSSVLRSSAMPLLDALGAALNAPQLRGQLFSIGGHTDSDGSDGYNEQLSRTRAQSVQRYLLDRYPLQAHRLTTIGYGERRPLLPNTSAENKQINRRVEIQTR